MKTPMRVRFKKWLSRFVKAVFALLAFASVLLFVWWWLQPRLPDSVPDLHDEYVASADYVSAANEASEMIREVAAELRLPSVSIAVSVNGGVKWAAALGMADLSSDRKADLRTSYRTGSVAKAMTGFAVAQLVRRQNLDLDASVREYVTSFPAKRWDVSLRQLGSHTGGVRHYADFGEPGFASEQFSKHHYATVEESLSFFKNDPLAYEPGTDFLYSTHGFTLLSAAMESATDATYPELMADIVWNPLEMRDTTTDDFTKPAPARAIPYVAIGGRAIHAEGPDPSYKWAGGGLLSTPTDLVRLGSAMLLERFVTVDQREEYFTPRPLADGSANPQRYALGWRNDSQQELLESVEPLAVMHHGGSSPGGSSFILLIPNGTTSAAVMTNVSIADPWPLRKALYQIAGKFRKVQLK